MGSQSTIIRRDPIITYYVAREEDSMDLLTQPPVNPNNPFSSTHWQMVQEDNLSPLEINMGLDDKDNMIESADLFIIKPDGEIISIYNIDVNRLLIPQEDGTNVIIKVTNLNKYFDTYNNPQPEFEVAIEIKLRNKKKIIKDNIHFMRYKLSGYGSSLNKYREDQYQVYEFDLYIDGVFNWQPQDDLGCKLGLAVINEVDVRYPMVKVEIVNLLRTWEFNQNTTEMVKLKYRPDIPETLPKDKISPMRIKVSLFDPRGSGNTATLEVYTIRENKILKQLAINSNL